MNNTKKAKRFLSMLLVLVMIITMFPVVNAKALTIDGTDFDIDETDVTGSGSKDDPYIVYTYEGLLAVFNGSKPQYRYRVYVELGCDIISNDKNNDYCMVPTDSLDFILDLKGYTLSRTATTTDDYLFDIWYSNLTIRDSSPEGTGTISIDYREGGYIIREGYGTLTIEGGDFIGTHTGGIYAYAADILITGGNFNTDKKTLCADSPSGNYRSSLTFTGGTFRTTSTREPCLYMTGIGDLLITGGYFEAQGEKNNAVKLYDTPSNCDIDYLIDGGTFACNYDALSEGNEFSGVIRLNYASGEIRNCTIMPCPGNAIFSYSYLDYRIKEDTTIMVGDKKIIVGNLWQTVPSNNSTVVISNDKYVFDVGFTGLDIPKSKQTPDFYVVPNDGSKYYVERVEWYDENNDKMSSTDTFKAGKKYMARTVLNAKDGYAFPDNPENLPLTMTGSVNGMAVSSIYFNGQKSLLLVYEFTADPSLPVITKQPVSVTINEGDSVTLHIEAENAKSYQWGWLHPNGSVTYVGGSGLCCDKASATTDTLVLNYLDYGMDGEKFVCYAIGDDGKVMSDAATITVNPVEYNLWVDGQQVTSKNKRSLCSGKARFYPYKNRLELYDGALITNLSESDEAGISGYGIRYHGEKDLIIRIDGECTIGKSEEYPIYQAVRVTGGGNLYIKGTNGKSDKLTMYTSGKAIQAVTTANCIVENCTLDITTTGDDCIYLINTEIIDADVTMYCSSEQEGEFAIDNYYLYNVPKKTVTISGESTLTLKGNNAALNIYEGDEYPKYIPLIYPSSAAVMVGNQADGSDKVTVESLGETTFGGYKYISFQSFEKTIGKVELSMTSPKAGELPSVPTSSNDLITVTDCVFMQGDNELDIAQDRFEEGKTYYTYVTVSLPEGYCFSNPVASSIGSYTGTEYARYDNCVGICISYTVPYSSVTVSGTVESVGSETDEITIQLITLGTSEPAYEAIVYGNSTTYTIPDVVRGRYTMVVKKQNNVTNTLDIWVSALADVVIDVQLTLSEDAYTGLKYVDGQWQYYNNGAFDSTKTGLVQGADSVFWYVNAGIVDTSYTGFITNGAGTWYVISGKIDTSFTGLGKDGDKWIAVFKGKAYPEFTGLIQNAGYFWYVKDGTLDTTYTGFYENENGKWYVANGKVDTSFKGLGKEGDKWLVVLGGKHDSTYTGLIKNGGAFWYVKDGVLDTTFTGITETGGASWLVVTGKLRDDYTGTYTDATGTYNIVNGKVTD